jgi:CRP/FNR family transcriptional regulator, cyclic AMP receptor protein
LSDTQSPSITSAVVAARTVARGIIKVTVTGLFVGATETRTCSLGDVIFSEGDSSPQMFGVITGAVDLVRGNQVVARVSPGGTFGEMGIIDHAPRSLTALAAEPSEIAVLDERSFLFLVQETPMFALQVMKSLAARVREHEAGLPASQYPR